MSMSPAYDNTGFNDCGFFVLRTPLLPIDEYLHLARDLEVPQVTSSDDVAKALERDRARLRRRLVALFGRSDLREALYLSSPELEERLASVDSILNSKDLSRIDRTLIKYLSRMAARPTPFGLAAGISVGGMGQATRLSVAARSTWRRHARLDMDYLTSISEALTERPELRAHLRYSTNTSVYRLGPQYRYITYDVVDGGRRYRLAAADALPELDAVMKRARGGATFGDLVSVVVGHDQSDAEAFIGTLIDRRLLVSTLDPQVTSDDPVRALTEVLSGCQTAGSVAFCLARASRAIDHLNDQPLGVPLDRYRELEQSLSELPAVPRRGRLVRVDLHLPCDGATLGLDIVQELEEGVRLLYETWQSDPYSSNGDPVAELREFREAFARRFGESEVSILRALDDDIGVPWRDVGQGAPPQQRGNREGDRDLPRGLSPRDAYLLARLVETHGLVPGSVLDLTHDDVHVLSAKRQLPESCVVMAKLAAPSCGDVAGRSTVYLRMVSAPSGIGWFGRFCDGNPGLLAAVRATLARDEEMRPDVLYADIVHLPFGLAGNFVCRPRLRRCEIPFFGQSQAEPTNRIDLEDLLVSVRDDRLVLRSRRLGVEVQPSLTNAHNPFQPGNLSIYRFLCLLQYQQVRPVSWSWGSLAFLPFLPRVVRGRLILSPARWKLDKRDVDLLSTQGEAGAFEAVRTLRERRGIPRWVFYVQQETDLLLDLENVICVDVLVRELRAAGGGLLAEVFPAPEDNPVRGQDGTYAHEILVPLRRIRRSPAVAPRRPPAVPLMAHPPGSDWLYVKAYTGPATAERLLCREFAQIAHVLESDPRVRCWFFIRYSDPDFHIRLRVRSMNRESSARILQAVLRRLQGAVRDGFVARLQLDTYVPELQRYGGIAGVALAEQLFRADSAACIALLRRSGSAAGQQLRIQLCLASTDCLLSDFGLSLTSKLEFTSRLARSTDVSNPVNGDKRARMAQVSAEFREHRREMEAALWSQGTAGLARARDILDRRSDTIQPIAAALYRAEVRGRISRTVAQMLPSYVHMGLNRLWRHATLPGEPTVYDLLSRLYRSRASREEAEVETRTPHGEARV
jgi:thiopeptide-type bacteriocin biosynthesis protein